MTNQNSEHCIILCTCADLAQAQTIAEALVQERLAACVNLIPKLHSIYMWQGKVEHSEEVQLIIKTRSVLFSAIQEKILTLHSYELPEIITVPIMSGLDSYLQWIDSSTSQPTTLS